MFLILYPLPQPQYNICFFFVSVSDTLHQSPTLYKSITMSKFLTLDVSALTGYAVAYDEETRTIFYYHTDELPSLTVLRQIKLLYPNTTIVLTDSIDDAKRFLGVGDAFRDVLTVAGEPVERIGLNIIN